MTFVQTRTLDMYVEQKGEGDPVLFISGTGGDLRVKPNVLDGPLIQSRNVIAYDQRGLGQAEKPVGPYTMAQYGDDAAELLDALDIGEVDVIGVSFGGMVAQHFAIRHPKLIRKLVLCCTSPGGAVPSYPFHELPQDQNAVERMLYMMDVSDTRRDKNWQQENPDKVEKLIEMTRAAVIADHEKPEFRRGYRLQLEARSHHDTMADLPRLLMPVLICAGRYDGIAPPENQHKLLELIPGATLNWYEGGHLFMIQDKKALPDILEFLN